MGITFDCWLVLVRSLLILTPCFSVPYFMVYVCVCVQAETDRKQDQDRLEKQEQEHKTSLLALEETNRDRENQIRDLKETIFELEDQVEQQRAVRLHTNQTILDLESTTITKSN